uniref:KH domain containing protein, putative n=1 Tax=Theileria annulata TaxID=5874 RepID=A0A3B0MJD3_THEAN
MTSESNEDTRNGDLNNRQKDDDGFQKVLTPFEKRVLKKKNPDLKQVSLADCNTLQNSIITRLKKRGLDLTNDPDHTTLESSSLELEEVQEIIADLDEAINGVLYQAEKPDQNLSLTELENKIKVAKNTLSQMKTKKKGTFSKEELDNATKETDVYVTYLQNQITLTKEYQKLKNAQVSLLKLKTFLKDYINLKTRIRNSSTKIEKNKVTTPTSEPKVLGTTKRSIEYVYDFIKEMKERNGRSLDVNDLTSRDFKVEDGTKFQPPYNYLQKLKQKFEVFIDKTGTKPLILSIYGCKADVDRCMDFLSSLDLSRQNKVPMSFTKYRLLLEAEDKYNVLLNYNSRTMELIGKSSDVKAFLEYMESITKENREKEKQLNNDTVKTNDVTYVTGDNDKLYDYYVLRALSGKFRPNVRELETEFGVGIKFDLTPRNGLAKVSFVPLLNNAVDGCIKTFTNYVDQYGYKELGKLSNEEISFLSDNDVQKKRYRSQYTTLVKVADKFYVVGLKKYLNFGFNRAQNLLESRQQPPYKFKLTNAQYHQVNPHLNSLQDQKGVYITTMGHSNSKEREKEFNDLDDHKNGSEKDITLLVYGNAVQQKECVAALNEMIKYFVTIDLPLSGVEYNLLLEEKNRLNEYENKYKLKLTLTKNTLTLSGPKIQVEAVLEDLKTLFSKVVYFTLDDPSMPEIINQGMVYSVMAVPQKFIGKIIGKGGSTLKNILLQTSLNNLIVTKSSHFNHESSNSIENLHLNHENPNSNHAKLLPNNIRDHKEKKTKAKQKDKEVDVLFMIGSGLSVHTTVSLIKHVLDSDEDVVFTKPDSRNLYDEYTSKHSFMRRTISNYSSSTSSSTNYKTDVKLDINDMDNFPSLY